MKHRLYSTTARQVTNLSTPLLRQTPTSTGAGPFISYPHFKPLSPLLSIALPSSSILNLRNETSILAANGELNDIKSERKVIKVGNKPVVFNQVYAESALSLILSNKNQNHFVNLELGKEQSWVVKDKRNLIGWYGGDLQLNPPTFIGNDSDNEHNNGVKFETGELTSKANLILANNAQLFTVELDQQDIINLDSDSVIAYQGTTLEIDEISYPRFPRLDANLQQLTSLGLKIAQYYQKVVKVLSAPMQDKDQGEVPVVMVVENSTILPPQLRKMIDSVNDMIYRYVYPSYTEFKGQGKIIVSK